MAYGGVNPDGNQLLLGRGKVYFDRFSTAGVKSGERFLGDCTVFEASPTLETKERYSSSDKSSNLLKRAIIRQLWEISIEFGEYSKDNIALALLGDVVSTTAQVATPVVSEPVGVEGIQLDRWYQLANRDLSFTSLKKGAATLTAATDYVVDTVSGRVLVRSDNAGSVAAGDITITANYTPVVKTYQKIRAGLTPIIEGKVTFIGDNVVGPNYQLEAWRCQVSPDAAFGLITDDFATPKLKASVLDDSLNHPTEPFFVARTLIGTP